MKRRCVECGAEIGAERAELGYTYCLATDCQARHRRGPLVTAVAVNKSGDSYRVGDAAEIDASAVAGELGAKNTTLGLDHRGAASATPRPAAGPDVAGRSARARVPRPRGGEARSTARAHSWSPSQENIVGCTPTWV